MAAISSALADASAQLLRPVASGPSRAYRSTKLRHVMASSSAEVTTESPSTATLSSMKSMPEASHAATSSSLIGRDASETSISPAQNCANPSPVPGPSTVIARSGFSSENAAPTAAEIGSTVDEPETAIDPETDPASAGASLPAGASDPSLAHRSRPAHRSSGRRCRRRIGAGRCVARRWCVVAAVVVAAAGGGNEGERNGAREDSALGTVHAVTPWGSVHLAVHGCRPDPVRIDSAHRRDRR